MPSKSKSKKHSKPIPENDSDIVWGATEIGKVINRSRYQAFYLLRHRRLPANYDGGRYSASKAKLIAYCAGEID
jgi:hypothetical protein